uniref:Uncharacterized protein n=1 Tax=Arundo donax TaxID=35708 RepID=A0A0A9GLJ0_ARUDO
MLCHIKTHSKQNRKTSKLHLHRDTHPSPSGDQAA